MKSDKAYMILLCIAAVGFYLAALLNFVGDDKDTSRGITYLCLGSAFLCFGGVQANKKKK